MRRLKALVKLFSLIILMSILGLKVSVAQQNVGIGTLTPNPNALLELVSNDKGFLVPRIDDTQRAALALTLNNTSDRGLLTYDLTEKLFYFWDGTAWIPFPGGSGGTDDQLLAIDVATNLLSIESGNSVDLSPYLDNTDDQVITNFSWDSLTQELTISIEDGNTQTVSIPFASVGNTDDQAISISNDTIYLEDGGFVVLPSGIVDTDDQTLTITNQSSDSVSIQIADGNEVTFNIEDADADPTNELQDLIQLSDTSFVISGTNDTIVINSPAGTDDQIISISNDTIYLEDGGFVVLPGGVVDTDDQAISISNDTIYLEDGGFVVLPSGIVDTDDQTLTVTNQSSDSVSIQIADGNEVTFNIEDADADPTNELQDLIQISDTSFVISGTNDTIVINSLAGTDDQIISISDDTIYLEDGGFVVLPGGVVDTDDQAISISNDTIYLEDGGFVVLPSGTVDTDDQTLTVTNQSSDSVSIQIADGNEVTFNIEDADADPTNELQDLIQLSDTSFVISGTNDTIVINSQAGTDDQIISISNDTIYLEDGGFVVLPGGVVDTDDQAISISNDTIYLEDGGFVVLPSGTIDTDDQTLTVTNQSSDSVGIQIADGNEVTFNIEDADADPTNELQDLIQLSDTSFVISGTNDTIVINSQAGTDDQIISISNDTIYLEDGGFVVLPGGVVDTDDQAISISNDTIYLEDGGFVVLPSGTVDTDDQTLTVTNQSSDSVSIQIADGNEVTFNIEDADADPTNELQDLIQLSDTSFVISGTNDTIVIISQAETDDQIISISNDTIYLEDGGFVVLPGGVVDTDDQAISISNDTIYLEDGGFVVLPGGTVDTDDQTLTVTNQSSDSVGIQIADGNEVTFNIEDADADPTNELQDLIQLSDTSFVISGTNDTIVINTSAGTDDQIISISNDTIYLEDGGFVVLPSGTVDTDDQTLTVTNQSSDSVSIQIADGNEVTFNIEDADADPTNELQDLIQLSDTSFVITGTNDTIVINSPAGTDDQIISISNDTIYLEDGGFVVLPSGTVDTDDQTLTVTNQSSDSVNIQIADGNEVTFNIEDADADPTNELQDLIQLSDTSFVITGTNDTIIINSPAGTDDQIISISNDTIYLEDGGFVVLPSGTVDTDDQTLTVTNQSSDSVSIQIADGNEVTFNIEDSDADPTNELQDLIQLSDTSFVISGTNDTIVINSPVGTDDQIISISNDTIYLEDGGFVVLPGGVVDTDDQAISISNDTIYLEDGGFVVLPSGTVDTDDQTLTVTNQSTDSVSIQIADGNEVTFNIEDSDADPTNELQDLIQLSDTSFVITGTNDTIVINIPAGTDDQIISISNDTIYLEDGGFVVLPDLDDHDWYEMGTTNAPDDINDTIWTEGVVVIGTNSGAVIGDTVNTALIVDGNILPTGCGAFDLGSISHKWRQLFVTSLGGFSACSDLNLKRNINKIGYGLEHILKLQAVKYQWNDSTNLGHQFEMGLIAQDVYKVIPEIVHVPDHAIENDVYTISYMELIPILIQAIQDQQQLIDDQQSQIDALETENQNMENFKAELDNIRSENDALKYRLENIEEFMRHLKQEVNKE